MKFVTGVNQNNPIVLLEWTPATHPEAFHRHSALEVGCCLKGYGSFHFEDKTYSIEPGDVFVVNNVERHIAVGAEKAPSRFIFMYFDPLFIEQFDRELLQPFAYRSKEFVNRIPCSLTVAERITCHMTDMLSEQDRQELGYRVVLQAQLFQICALLLRHYGHPDATAELQDFYKIQPALHFLQKHFRDPIELENLAEHLSLSPSRTRHFFKDVMGEGFKEYLLHMRVSEAKRLLSTTDSLIVDVCLESGFQSHTPFYRAFKQFVGITPQEYRDRSKTLKSVLKEPDDNFQ